MKKGSWSGKRKVQGLEAEDNRMEEERGGGGGERG